MKTPEEIAAEIVNQFAWTSNVMVDGRLMSQQHAVKLAIAEAIREDRAMMTQPIRLEDVRQHVGEGRLPRWAVLDGVNATLRNRAFQ